MFDIIRAQNSKFGEMKWKLWQKLKKILSNLPVNRGKWIYKVLCLKAHNENWKNLWKNVFFFGEFDAIFYIQRKQRFILLKSKFCKIFWPPIILFKGTFIHILKKVPKVSLARPQQSPYCITAILSKILFN